jgi:pyrroline-5-carboxylate reductase
MKTNIAIIGSGNLGIALAKGLVNSQLLPADCIVLTRRNRTKLEETTQGLGVRMSTDNKEAVSTSDIVILCVQPKQLEEVLIEIHPLLKEGKHLLVSTITGVSIDEIGAQLGNKKIPIVRAMPNTAIAIGASMTCLCHKHANEAQVASIIRLFNCLGETLLIEERLMKAATVLAASGIAFFMRYLRAATQAGIQLGFDASEAQHIAVQTAKGAALLLQTSHSHPEYEIDKVTTPEGCTIAGLNEMEHQGLSSALIKGILTSFEKINSIRK